MPKFYVSLVRDLLGYYIEYTAESERAVRTYIVREYGRGDVYTLPWCSVYTESEMRTIIARKPASQRCEIIKSICGTLYEE